MTDTGATSAPDPEAAVTPGQPAPEALVPGMRLSYTTLYASEEVPRAIEVSDSVMVDVDAAGRVLGVETLDGSDWQNGLVMLAMQGRLRYLPAAKDPDAGPLPRLRDLLAARRERDELEQQLAEAGRELIRLASAERDASEERDGLASQLRTLADTWDGVALGMDHATHAGQAGELAERARELRLVMRMAGVKPEAPKDAEDGGTAVEWAVFHGGPDPDNCAGYEVMRDQADAEEEAQWRIQSGVARRTVAYGPWEVMTGEDDGTETAAILADPDTTAAIAEGDRDLADDIATRGLDHRDGQHGDD